MRIAVIPGDGIGIEVTAEATKVLRAVTQSSGKQVQFTEFDWGADRFLRDGTTLPEDAPEMLRKNFDAILFGAVGDPRVPFHKYGPDILLGLRFKLDLYANVRPCVLFDKRLTPLRDRGEADVNFTVIRENTEGQYVGIGGQFKKNTPDEVAMQEDVNTRKGVERIIRFAFDYARKHGKKRVCMSDKHNALPHGHDLWQRVFAIVRAEYPEIQARHLLIDTLCMEMVRDPAQFDVIVSCNLFGDILSDLGAQLAGGLGLAPSASIHPGSVCLFEPVHGTAPNIAGQNKANPFGAILTAAMLLEHLDCAAEAAKVTGAVRSAVAQGKVTAEIGGSLGTRELGDWIASHL